MPKDDSTWLNVFYVISGALGALVVYKLFLTLGITFGWAEKYDSWYPMSTTGVSVLSGALFAYFLRANPARHEYLLSAVGEVRKVSWPSWDDTKRMTMVVVIVVALFAAVLSVFDMSWAYLLKQILA